jgi:hypothetical protein
MVEIQTLVNQTHCSNSFHVFPLSPLKVFEEDGILEPKAAVIMDQMENFFDQLDFEEENSNFRKQSESNKNTSKRKRII